MQEASGGCLCSSNCLDSSAWPCRLSLSCTLSRVLSSILHSFFSFLFFSRSFFFMHPAGTWNVQAQGRGIYVFLLNPWNVHSPPGPWRLLRTVLSLESLMVFYGFLWFLFPVALYRVYVVPGRSMLHSFPFSETAGRPCEITKLVNRTVMLTNFRLARYPAFAWAFF
jgi:hypothetical protein